MNVPTLLWKPFMELMFFIRGKHPIFNYSPHGWVPAIHAQQYNTPKLILLALVQCSQVSAKAQAHAFVNVSVVCEEHEISSAPIKYQPFSAPRKSSTSSRTPQHAVI